MRVRRPEKSRSEWKRAGAHAHRPAARREYLERRANDRPDGIGRSARTASNAFSSTQRITFFPLRENPARELSLSASVGRRSVGRVVRVFQLPGEFPYARTVSVVRKLGKCAAELRSSAGRHS